MLIVSAQLKMLKIPDRSDYHEMLIERFVKCLLNIVLGPLNMITFDHLTSHKTARSRLGQKQPSRDSSKSNIKNRNQKLFPPRERPKDQYIQLQAEVVLFVIQSPWLPKTKATTVSLTCHLLQTFQDHPVCWGFLDPLSQLPTQCFFDQ